MGDEEFQSVLGTGESVRKSDLRGSYIYHIGLFRRLLKPTRSGVLCLVDNFGSDNRPVFYGVNSYSMSDLADLLKDKGYSWNSETDDVKFMNIGTRRRVEIIFPRSIAKVADYAISNYSGREGLDAIRSFIGALAEEN